MPLVPNCQHTITRTGRTTAGWLGLVLVLAGSVAASPAARASDVLVIYRGYSDDNAFKRTIAEVRHDLRSDNIVDVVDAEEIERRFSDLLVIEGDGEIIARCRGGRPPDLKLLEDDLEDLKRDLDFQGQVYAYDVAIDELLCAGESLSGEQAAKLFIERGMVHYKNGDEDLAQDDFRSAFVVYPGLEWNNRHTPKARDSFDAAKRAADDTYSYSLYVADAGPSGSGIRVDGRSVRPGDPEHLLPGEHMLAWSSRDGGDMGILSLWGSATLIGPMGLFDFLFRDPVDRIEERLHERVLEEIAWLEDVDEVLLVEPILRQGSLANAGRYSSPARAGLGTGYARMSTFDYGALFFDLWIRASGIVHVETRVEFDMTNGRATGVEPEDTDGDGVPDEDAVTLSDYYALPSVTLGIGFRETHGPIQPGGGLGLRLYFTGPSLIVMPGVVGHGGVDIRPWSPPVVLRVNMMLGANLASAGNDKLGRSLAWEGGGRVIFGLNVGAGFIL